ncbi:SDR family oxidoreductase [Paenibacillus sp. SI8]|uniref:SDR family oxidoreductase n=1 Tax=unclassified Paenibacillus TaxID=185978 RepID=UPI003466830C
MTNTNKVLVYGAAGVQGGAAARKLLAEGYIVQAIARNQKKADQLAEQGIHALIGDMADYDSLVAASQGVSIVLLSIPVEFNLERARKYYRNAVDAAKQANVELLVVNTSVYVPNERTDLVAIELKRELIDYVKQSGVPSIILQPTLYLENFLIPGILNNQTLAYPVPAEEAIAWVSIEDAASYAVYACNHPELEGTTINVTGPEALTGNQLAELFSQTLEQDVHFYSLPVETFEAAITPLLGTETASGLAGLYHWVAANTASLPQHEGIHSAIRSAIPGTLVAEWINGMIKQGYITK